MIPGVYTDYWPEEWGPVARGAASGLIIGNIAGVPAFVALLVCVRFGAPLWIGWAGIVWMAASAFVLLRSSRRRLKAEHTAAVAALRKRHEAEIAELEAWIRECQEYLERQHEQ